MSLQEEEGAPLEELRLVVVDGGPQVSEIFLIYKSNTITDAVKY